LKQGRALGDVPPIHESDLSRKKLRLTEQEWCDDPMKSKFSVLSGMLTLLI
jgi:hypothetical protein